MAAVLETAGSFTTTTVIYDDEPEDAMSGNDDLTAALGPFETSGDALLAVRPEDGSFTGREALFDLLKKTLHATDVTLAGRHWQHPLVGRPGAQTVAVIAGWVGGRTATGGSTATGKGSSRIAPSAGTGSACSSALRAGHFKGDPAPGGQRQLVDPGHAAVAAWCKPPGRVISPAEPAAIRRALADAERYRRDPGHRVVR